MINTLTRPIRNVTISISSLLALNYCFNLQENAFKKNEREREQKEIAQQVQEWHKPGGPRGQGIDSILAQEVQFQTYAGVKLINVYYAPDGRHHRESSVKKNSLSYVSIQEDFFIIEDACTNRIPPKEFFKPLSKAYSSSMNTLEIATSPSNLFIYIGAGPYKESGSASLGIPLFPAVSAYIKLPGQCRR